MFGMTLAGLSGVVMNAVVVGFLVGAGCAWAEGAIFAQVPAMFPNSSGAVAGIVGGVGTVGGIVYPKFSDFAPLGSPPAASMAASASSRKSAKP